VNGKLNRRWSWAKFLELERLIHDVEMKKASADDCRAWILENGKRYCDAWRLERDIANDVGRATSELQHLRVQCRRSADALKEAASFIQALLLTPDCPSTWRSSLMKEGEKYMANACQIANAASAPKPVGRDTVVPIARGSRTPRK
jgi:hypothetical protein